MKFLATVLLLGAAASPVLSHALPNVDGAVSSRDAYMAARPAELFARKRKACEGTCNENGCHCTNPVRVCSCSSEHIGQKCECA